MHTHRAEYLGIMAGTVTCWSCKAETNVASIVLDEWEELPEELDDEIQPGDSPAMLTYITELSPDALAIYQAVAPWVSLLPSGSAGQNYWANACVHCGALQGDYYLHEADGPFFPGTAAQEGLLTLNWHPVPIEATASYSQAWWFDKYVARNPKA